MRITSFSPPVELSDSPTKRVRFAAECYFQEVFYELLQVDPQPCWSAIARKAFVLFKTDAGAVRCVQPVMDILAEHGMRVVQAQPIQLDRLSIRELWRYELNVSTYDRYPAVDALLGWAPSLFAMVEATAQYRSRDSVAATLSYLKGPSSLRSRAAHHIRHRIRALDGMFNHIHTPDEPLDVLREIGVLFSRHERRAMVSWLAGRTPGMPDGVSAAIHDFYHKVPLHSLELGPVLDKIRSQGVDDPQEFVSRALATQSIDELRTWIGRRGIRLSYWDAVVLFITHRSSCHAGVVPLSDYAKIEDRRHGA